jgi:DNA primase
MRLNDLHNEALLYHQRLPERLWKYLNGRGIPNDLIHKHLLGWNGRRITIPILDRQGQIAFFKLAKDPADNSDSPKMFSTPGAHAELYGWEQILAKPEQIIICEGEFDRLVLEGQGFPAVTSTGGAGVFRPEWAEAFQEIPTVYVCFDNDAAGRAGADRVARLIPRAKVVRLPAEVGEHGDVTDFFVRLGRNREDSLRLLERAQPMPARDEMHGAGTVKVSRRSTASGDISDITSQIKIEALVGRYLSLRPSGKNLIARCPFHEDHHPSFVVYPATQSFYCFGCRAHGDAVGFLMRMERLTFPEALKVMRQLAQ